MTAALILFLGFFGVRGVFFNTLALEQEVRCGIPAHSHSTECYKGTRRICGMEEHHHGRNCYLILLEDNNINDLLVQMAAMTDNSLESVIGRTVDNALVYNTDLTSPLAAGSTLSDVAALNRTVAENNVQPSVVFNENIQLASTSSNDTLGAALPTATQPQASTGSSTYAIGDVTTESGWANYYIRINSSWTSVGTLQYELVTSSSWLGGTRYTARESVSDILALYNGVLGTNLKQNEVRFYVSTSATQQGNQISPNNGMLVYANSSSSYTSATQPRYIRMTRNNGQNLDFYTVTLEHADGDKTVAYVRSGESFTLPSGAMWKENGKEYNGGTTIQNITSARTFYSETYVEEMILSLQYNVRFPDLENENIIVDTTPTLQGSAASSTTETVTEGSFTRIKGVSDSDVIGAIENSGTGQHRAIHFMGWRVGSSDTILSPGTGLSWDELSTYSGGRDSLTLNGVWEYDALQTVSFFIRYDSVAVDTNGNITSQDSNKYTNEVYAAFFMGVDTSLSSTTLSEMYLVADSADNSYTADQTIRALYGQKAEGVWFTSFPKDEDIFELLKPYAKTGNLQVATNTGTEVITTDQLNANYCSIRWYVLKCQDDAWHVDGRLVKKEGILDITKTFAGNAAAITAAKNNFSITVTNKKTNDVYTLRLTGSSADDPSAPYSVKDGVYRWRIKGLTYNDPITITEHPGNAPNVIVHSDYRVVDTYGSRSTTGTGQTLDVLASTVATDMDEWYPLTVNFTNIYHNTDSIIIKKEDDRTGNPLGGAVFQLLQRGQVMRFTYDSATNSYLYDPNGELTSLSGSTNGYYELNITNFSYTQGSIVVKELVAPNGYTRIDDIIIGYSHIPIALEATPTDVAAAAMATPSDIPLMPIDGELPEVQLLSNSPMAEYRSGLLIIRNSTDNTSVTVNKQWNCSDADWRPVTMQLMANGAPVTSLLSNVQLTQVLTAENGWSATWGDLPLYANGQPITWSVKEIKIGDETHLGDYTFVNWLVQYGPAVETKADDGRVTNTAFTVTNDTYRTLLYVVKTDTGGVTHLGGAVFTLERMRGAEVDSSFTPRQDITDANGTITFDNLEHGDYRLSEIQSPAGYEKMDQPIYLTLHLDGTVSVQDHPYAKPGDSAYTVRVVNRMMRPLPATGGPGTAAFYFMGLLLIAGALISLPLRGKCRTKVRRRGL